MDNTATASPRHHSKKRKHRHRSQISEHREQREPRKEAKRSERYTEELARPSLRLIDLPVEVSDATKLSDERARRTTLTLVIAAAW